MPSVWPVDVTNPCERIHAAGAPVRYLLSANSARSATAATTDAPASGQAPDGPHLLDRDVWRDAALIWLAQRIGLLAIAFLGARMVGSGGLPGQLLTGWYRWDSAIYAGIAQSGYQHQWQSAFYPMLPGLEHLLAPAVGGDPFLAGFIIANVAAFFALGLLRALVERELGHAAAVRALVYLVAFPTAFFLIAPYTESLFLLFSAACFVALRRHRWLAAGLCAALAALTRPFGVLLVAPILVELLLTWRAATGAAGHDGRDSGARLMRLTPAFGALALPVLAIAGFILWLRPRIGSTSPMQSELATGWGRDLTAPGVGYLRDAAALFAATNSLEVAHILLDTAFTTLLIALTVALWRRLPPAYIAYSWVSTALILMTPSHGWTALASNMRFMLVIFPLFMLLGQWGRRPWAHALILACSLSLLALKRIGAHLHIVSACG